MRTVQTLSNRNSGVICSAVHAAAGESVDRLDRIEGFIREPVRWSLNPASEGRWAGCGTEDPPEPSGGCLGRVAAALSLAREDFVGWARSRSVGEIRIDECALRLEGAEWGSWMVLVDPGMTLPLGRAGLQEAPPVVSNGERAGSSAPAGAIPIIGPACDAPLLEGSLDLLVWPGVPLEGLWPLAACTARWLRSGGMLLIDVLSAVTQPRLAEVLPALGLIRCNEFAAVWRKPQEEDALRRGPAAAVR